MVHAGDFTAAPSDELTLRTLPTFFTVLQLLLTAGVTTVAEAAFQDRLWRPGWPAPQRHAASLRQTMGDETVKLTRTTRDQTPRTPIRRVTVDNPGRQSPGGGVSTVPLPAWTQDAFMA
ncbi:hypothetical protein ACFY2R_27710 [Micromonospora olivasterospora]|uniref:Uncharacterized protein n=1 Tax=Micromonospora olivasterospora TaxID=1880 RepID=A0A562IER8_MICOL|nr:hypothetical protein [Micromonospora olivasterospora]TWH69511.1 hypothetical protein JD77_04521 [Micromonospora olivasterospora]